ncbi:hypothetical protein F2C03_06860 [Salmonella enterica]|nr:hypothetical protein [Salmonella enterica]
MSKRKSNRLARRLLGMPYWESNKRKALTWSRSLSLKSCFHGYTVILTPEEIREVLSQPAPWLLPFRCRLTTIDIQELTK